MNTTFTIETVLTKKLCVDTARYMIWHNAAFMIFLCIGIILAGIFPLYAVSGYSLREALAADAGFIPGLFLAAAVLCAPWFIGRKMYQKNGGRTITLTFGAEQIVINDTHKIIKMPYSGIKKYRQTDKYFFISTGGPDSIIYVADKNSFIAGTPEDFSSFLHGKLKT